MVFDVFFGILLLLGLSRGYQKGFARQMLTLTGLVLGVLFGETIARQVEPLVRAELQTLPEGIRASTLSVATLFAVWFSVVVIGVVFLKWYRRHLWGTDDPSFGDRLFGSLFGVAKGGLMVLVVCAGFQALPASVREQSMVQQQKEASKGFAMTSEIRLVEQIINAPEAQKYSEHVMSLVRYFRSSNVEAIPPK